MLFFKTNLYGGQKHPNVDTRLQNAIRLFNPSDESSIWPILSLFMSVWDEQFSLGLTKKPAYDNYKELFYDLLSPIK